MPLCCKNDFDGVAEHGILKVVSGYRAGDAAQVVGSFPKEPRRGTLEPKACGALAVEVQMAETSRRAFFKTAEVVTVGAPGGLSPAVAQNTEPATDYEAFVRLSCIFTGLSEKELPSAVEQQGETGARLKLYEVYLQRLRTSGVSGNADEWEKITPRDGASYP